MIGDKIKALREERSWTQEFVAKKMGININTLASYERNNREPKIETIKAFAKFFNVTSDYLLDLTDYRSPEAAAIGDEIELSDKAILQLQNLPGVELDGINALLESPKLNDLGFAMRRYTNQSSLVLPMAAYDPFLPRANMTDEEKGAFVTGMYRQWALDAFNQVLAEITPIKEENPHGDGTKEGE